MKVFIDAGHGGKDPGALGNGLQEKDIALSVALKVGEVLKRHNIEVLYSRAKDEFIDLTERSRMANSSNVDIFVSVHCNSFSNPNSQGVEVYAYHNAQDGKKLSQNILDSIVVDNLYTKNRGVKTANFAVLRETKMVATLVELGFISNVEDVAILTNKQNELAESVAKGILNYLGIKYIVGVGKKEDNQYEKAVQELVLAGIVGSPAVWNNLEKVHVNNVKSLIIKMAAYLNQGA